jgi:hypothetical protein
MKSFGSMRWVGLAYMGLASALIVFGGCHEHIDDDAGWACSAERAGQTRCSANGEILYCHGSGDPHFDVQRDCKEQSLACVNTSDSAAACVEGTACQASETRCEQNTAYRCVNGLLEVEMCGTLQECSVGDNGPVCQLKAAQDCGGHGTLRSDNTCECDEGYEPKADDPLVCVASPSTQQ